MFGELTELPHGGLTRHSNPHLESLASTSGPPPASAFGVRIDFLSASPTGNRHPGRYDKGAEGTEEDVRPLGGGISGKINGTNHFNHKCGSCYNTG